MSEKAFDAEKATKAAISSIGLGYDLTSDLRFKYCKRESSDPRLIAIDDDQVQVIECCKGDRMRLCSDVLSFKQMSEQFNQEISLSGKIPTGHFNAAFEFSGAWQKDAAYTQTLAFDGVSITLYNIAFEKTQVVLRDHVKQAVPSSWDPAALARFINKYGTHIVVGVKIGGTDIIYAKQQYSSPLQPADVKKKLKEMADNFFDQKDKLMKDISSSSYFLTEVQDIKFMGRRKGGSGELYLTHNQWCQTVLSHPDVISMSFIPITSLLNGVNGSGFLAYAINLYLRYKPPIEELYQFLEFQLPRQWAPILGELSLGPDRKPQSTSSLQFSFLGPKLHVNTLPVDVGKKPITGLRLYLEGKKSNCLAIHLQHLSSLPKTFQLQYEANENVSNRFSHVCTAPVESELEHYYYEKVQWIRSNRFSHVCTAPVESDGDNSVVTGAHFEVKDKGLKKILFLRLHFAKVSAAISRRDEWDGSAGLTQKFGIFSSLISTTFSTAPKPPPRPSEVDINSALYPDGPPVPMQTPKLQRFVDTTEMTRGPQDSPGYWMVSGARLFVENGKITLRVKYSLLVFNHDEEAASF